jgi:hypothetical protein
MSAHKYLLFVKDQKTGKNTLGSYEKGRDEKHYWNVE